MIKAEKMIQVAVCGAHMRGLPLNGQLTDLGGIFVKETTTSEDYRLYKLNGFNPARPGLLRTISGGVAISLEIWELPIKNYGIFVAGVPAPLGFGAIKLADGSTVQGFLCEHYSTLDGVDISSLGGWRSFLKSNQSISKS